VPRPSWVQAIRDLAWIGFGHAPGWTARPPYAYPLRFLTFNPPLIHPLQADLVAIGIWGEVGDGFDLERLRGLDAAITDWTRANPNHRRYAQSELLFPDFDYRAHFDPVRYERLGWMKQTLDPLGLLNRGVVETPAAALVRGS